MVILKKLRAATLVETMVSSVIIIIVFLIASLSLNNVFRGSVANNDSALKNRVKELTYLTINSKLSLPHYEETESWDVSIEKRENTITLTTINKSTLEEQTRILIETP